jgi:hypothetical protein
MCRDSRWGGWKRTGCDRGDAVVPERRAAQGVIALSLILAGTRCHMALGANRGRGLICAGMFKVVTLSHSNASMARA